MVCLRTGQVPFLQASVVVAPAGAFTVNVVIRAPVEVYLPTIRTTGLGLIRLVPAGGAVGWSAWDRPGRPGRAWAWPARRRSPGRRPTPAAAWCRRCA